MKIAPLADGGIIKEWPPWEKPPPAILPLSGKATQDFVRWLDDEIVVNVVIEVTPCV